MDEASSHEFGEVLDAEKAYDLYHANLITDKKDF